MTECFPPLTNPNAAFYSALREGLAAPPPLTDAYPHGATLPPILQHCERWNEHSKAPTSMAQHPPFKPGVESHSLYQKFAGANAHLHVGKASEEMQKNYRRIGCMKKEKCKNSSSNTILGDQYNILRYPPSSAKARPGDPSETPAELPRVFTNSRSDVHSHKILFGGNNVHAATTK